MTLFVFSSKGIVSFNFAVSNLSNGVNNCGTLILLIIFFFHCIVAGCVRESDIIVFTSCNLCTCLLRPGGGVGPESEVVLLVIVFIFCVKHIPILQSVIFLFVVLHFYLTKLGFNV